MRVYVSAPTGLDNAQFYQSVRMWFALHRPGQVCTVTMGGVLAANALGVPTERSIRDCDYVLTCDPADRAWADFNGIDCKWLQVRKTCV